MTLTNPLPPLGEEPFDDDAVDDYFENTSASIEDRLASQHPVARWQIENDDQAEWAARKLAAAGLLIREKETLRNWWVSQIEDWFRSETMRAHRSYSFFEGRLQDYALRERVEHGRATIKLPTAEFGTSARQAKVDVADDETLAAYLDDRLLRPPVGAGDEGLARWRAWWDAVEAVKESDESLVRRAAKVYVGPLRKLVRIEERSNGYEVRVVQSCGHEQTWFAETLDDETPVVGEIIRCDVCDNTLVVQEVEFLPVVDAVVVGPDGQPVPGVVVDPGGIEPKKVTPRG